MKMELWQKELQQCVRTLDQLEQHIPLPNKEVLKKVLSNMRLSITPHTLKRIDFSNPNDPILRMSVPTENELGFFPEELRDPIGDEIKSPIPFLTHRYPDRVLVYPTFFCSLFCRFCFRRFKTGVPNSVPSISDAQKIEAYIRSHEEIEEVIFTGGDPLTLNDMQIHGWLSRIRAIPTVRRIRFHTRTLVNLPSRFIQSLIDIFLQFQDSTHPIFLVTHFNHAQEIAQENIDAIAKLVNSGIVVRNQSVLLNGVNDDPKILEDLFKGLVDMRVIPYYLHQLDLAQGTNHFRVPLERGMEIMKSLQGKVTGLAIPKYMLDIPNGKGKIPLTHQFIHKQGDQKWQGQSPFGEAFEYMEPDCK